MSVSPAHAVHCRPSPWKSPWHGTTAGRRPSPLAAVSSRRTFWVGGEREPPQYRLRAGRPPPRTSSGGVRHHGAAALDRGGPAAVGVPRPGRGPRLGHVGRRHRPPVPASVAGLADGPVYVAGGRRPGPPRRHRRHARRPRRVPRRRRPVRAAAPDRRLPRPVRPVPRRVPHRAPARHRLSHPVPDDACVVVVGRGPRPVPRVAPAHAGGHRQVRRHARVPVRPPAVVPPARLPPCARRRRPGVAPADRLLPRPGRHVRDVLGAARGLGVARLRRPGRQPRRRQRGRVPPRRLGRHGPVRARRRRRAATRATRAPRRRAVQGGERVPRRGPAVHPGRPGPRLCRRALVRRRHGRCRRRRRPALPGRRRLRHVDDAGAARDAVVGAPSRPARRALHLAGLARVGDVPRVPAGVRVGVGRRLAHRPGRPRVVQRRVPVLAVPGAPGAARRRPGDPPDPAGGQRVRRRLPVGRARRDPGPVAIHPTPVVVVNLACTVCVCVCCRCRCLVTGRRPAAPGATPAGR